MRTLPDDINRKNKKSSQPPFALMEEVIAKAKKAGATEVMVSTQEGKGFSIDVRMGEVENIAFNDDKGIQLVVYFGHRKGSASSTDFSVETIDTVVRAACEIAKVSTEDPCFGLAEQALMKDKHPELSLFHPWALEPKEAIEKALACERHALSLDKKITNSEGVNISTHTLGQAFMTSHGGRGSLSSTHHSLSCSLIAKEGEKMQRDYDYTVAIRPEDLVLGESLAASAVERTRARLGAKALKTQRLPVIFSSRVSSGIFSSFIQAIQGNNLYRKRSFLQDALGQQLFPAGFKIYEAPYLPGALGSKPYDGEGVPTRDNVFIQDGYLCQYVLNSYAARRMGLQTTANAGGVHNLTIDPDTQNLEDLLKKMDKGLLITELMGHGVNGLTGDYSRGATGFWVENGKIQFPVEGVTVASNLKDMFKNILGIAQDINPNFSTRCGSVLIQEMTVAGN